MTVKVACVVIDCSDALLVGTWTLMADPEGNEFDLAKAL
jgi:hypothetical protein